MKTPLYRLALFGLVLATASCSETNQPSLPTLTARTGDVAVDNPDYRTLKNDINAIEGINTRPLLASAEASEQAFMRGNTCAAAGALGALGNKLAVLVDNPDYVDDPNIRLVLADIAGIHAVLPPDPCIDNPNI